MRKLIILTFSFVLLSNCSKKDEKTEESESFGAAVSGMKNLNNLSNSIEGATKRVEELKVMTPLSNDELKAAIPETVLGLERTSISVGDASMMNLSSAEAVYNNDDQIRNVKITVMDGAGETGSAMVTLMMMTMNTTSEKTTEDGFEKSGEFNGVKAKISETKSGEQINSEINYLVANRFMLTITGRGYTVEELKNVMNDASLSSLK